MHIEVCHHYLCVSALFHRRADIFLRGSLCGYRLILLFCRIALESHFHPDQEQAVLTPVAHPIRYPFRQICHTVRMRFCFRSVGY